MILYFLRHGLAGDYATWNGDDSLRPLTDKGRKKLAQIAQRLKELEVAPDWIVTSPYLRASQTAEIAAAGLDKKDKLVKDPRLSPGFDLAALTEIIKDYPQAECLMFVGHEPDFSEVTSDLIGGGRLIFKKAGLARVDLSSRTPPQGELAWFLPPGVLIGE